MYKSALGVILRRKWPYDGCVADLDFIHQRYFWGGRQRKIADFTTYTLNGSTFDAYGLTPSSTIDVTVALSGLGTVVPGSCILRTYATSAPANTSAAFELDDGTSNERIMVAAQAATGNMLYQVHVGGAAQASIFPSILTSSLGHHGVACTWAANNFLTGGDGVAGTADSSGTLPTVTTIRIGKSTAGSTSFPGAVGRIVLFGAARTQPELLALSRDILVRS